MNLFFMDELASKITTEVAENYHYLVRGSVLVYWPGRLGEASRSQLV